jgi:hypothetical protein
MPIEIPEYVLKAAPWSISKAGVIEKCSLQFDYKYGPKKIKETDQYEESRVGVAVHAALEMVLGGHDQKKSFMIAGDNEGLTTDELDQLNGFWDQVERFNKSMNAFKRDHKVKETFIERRWGVLPDFKGCEFFDKKGLFRGVLDYGMLTARGDMVIVDHKSGKEKDLSYYDKQFRGYAIMALAKNPSIKGVQTAINFIATDNMPWNPYITAEQIRDEYNPWLIKYLTESAVGLTKDPVGKEGWWCNWCSFRSICPLKGGSGRVDEAK